MSAREIMAKVFSGAPYPSKRTYDRVTDVLDALTAAGYVILSPDEVREHADGLQCAISSMAGECEGNHRIALNTLDRAIRSLKGGRDAQ